MKTTFLVTCTLIVASIASTFSPECFGQNDRPAQQAPRTVRDLLFEYTDNVRGYSDSGILIGNLASEYASVPAMFRPDDIETTFGNLFTETFMEPFQWGESGFESWGAPGALDINSFTTVQSYETGAGVTLTELEMYRVPVDATIPIPTSWEGAEGYIYAARFGDKAHVGVAVRFVFKNDSQIVFIPFVEIPDGGLITASDAAAYLEMLRTGQFKKVSFVDWALERYASQARLSGPAPRSSGSSRASSGGCDAEAATECIDDAYEDAERDFEREKKRHEKKIKKLKEAFSDDAEDGLWESVLGGAVVGGTGGSLLPGAGTASGAAVGAITGGVAWLWNTADDAEDLESAIDDANDEHNQKNYEIAEAFSSAAKDCVAEHCPDLLEPACEILDDMLDSLP